MFAIRIPNRCMCASANRSSMTMRLPGNALSDERSPTTRGTRVAGSKGNGTGHQRTSSEKESIRLLRPFDPGTAIQKAREAAQDAVALDYLTLFGKAEITFHAANATYTDSLFALPGLPATIASVKAEADGHTFSILSSSSTAFRAESRRTVLAKTGNQDLHD
jgi:hypothetical protein